MNEFSTEIHGPKGHQAVLRIWRTGDTNLGYLVNPKDSSGVIAVDVTSGEQLLQAVAGTGKPLTTLLMTHFHHDHVNGLNEVVEHTGCAFYAAAPFEELLRLHVTDGMTWKVEGLEILALETSGHSPLDISYRFPELDLCFCGDTLFGWGCGRMFAGPPETFWNSLQRLRALPPETRLCCGHDFRPDNLRFMQEQLPPLPWVEEGIRRIEQELSDHRFPEPLILKDQIATNPFLRADDPELAKGIGRAGAAPAGVFAELRKRRNSY